MGTRFAVVFKLYLFVRFLLLRVRRCNATWLLEGGSATVAAWMKSSANQRRFEYTCSFS